MASELDNGMLEPHNAYHSHYKDEFKANTEILFDELTEKSKVDVEANRQTIKTINELNKQIKEFSKKKNSLKAWNSLMFVSVILLGVAALVTFLSRDSLKAIIWISLLIAAIAWFAFALFIHFKWLRPKIKNLENELRKLTAERDNQIQIAWGQMAPLNALYDWNMAAHLIEKTVPLIDMDQYFDARKAAYLRTKYGFETGDEDTSTVYVQSGSILGNPFLLCRDYQMNMYTKTWEGSITIHWTTTTHTKNGTQTVHHTQTLRAYVQAPAPSYHYISYLVYGNDAAPKLSFSRKPSGMTGKTEKEIKKFVKKKAKENTKKAEKALVKGGTYQTFGNEEFEAIFGGTDRDNELEYRLLFTPLAQKNLLNLIEKGKPYGDDFGYKKRKCLNYIQTRHGQSFNYYTNPTIFLNYDYDKAREYFINYHCKYFESFYFELAPLMCIPLYQQHKSLEYLYDEEIDANFSDFEYEQMANSFNANELKHSESITSNIFKTERIATYGNSDKVQVTARSFGGINRVTYIQKRGGDGYMHTIPVHWIEYYPVEKTTDMLVAKAEATRLQYNIKASTPEFADSIRNIAKSNSYHFERCVFASLLMDDCDESNIRMFDSVLTKDTSSVQTLDEMLKSMDGELAKFRTNSVEQNQGTQTEAAQGEATEVKEEDVKVVDEEEIKKQENEKPQDDLADENDLDNDNDDSDDNDSVSDSKDASSSDNNDTYEEVESNENVESDTEESDEEK